MTRDQDIQTTTRALYDVIALQDGLADALAELGPKPLREPDVMVMGARCANCGRQQNAFMLPLDRTVHWYPVRLTAEQARAISKFKCESFPGEKGCGARDTLLVLEPVPDGTP